MVWWYMPVILSIGNLTKDDYGVEASLGFTTTSRPVCTTQRDLVSNQNPRAGDIVKW